MNLPHSNTRLLHPVAFYLSCLLAVPALADSQKTPNPVPSLALAQGQDNSEWMEFYRKAARSADVILLGTVRKLQFKTGGDPDSHGDDTYTFVTYEIETVLKGTGLHDSFRIMLWGGMRADGSIIMAADGPTFHEGDRELVFLKGNGENGDPIRARLSVKDTEVFTAGGSVLQLTPDNKLVGVPNNPGTTPISLDDFLAHLRNNIPDADFVSSESSASADPEKPVPPKRFDKWMTPTASPSAGKPRPH